METTRTAHPTYLAAFLRGYVECALWLTDENPGSGQWSQHGQYTVENVAPEAMAKMGADCARFVAANLDRLELAEEISERDAEYLGHDFWLTRNRHGSGFWDRGDEPVWSELTDSAHAYGEQYMYLGDDGRLYVS